jgi:pyruvate dehydrogenase E1 component alpha subunit
VTDALDKLKLLETMVLIRHFDEKVGELYGMSKLAGSTHLYVGEEAIAVGVIAHLRRDDYITSTHRGHGHCIAKGGELKPMFAELMGRRTGYCKGKGGSMHIADISFGHLGANGIVGGGLTIATGAALASKVKKTDQVVVCFFGDGAVNIGGFHESLNLAGLWSLPVVYVCENNLYGMSTHVKKAASVDRLEERASGYGIPGRTVNGMDVEAVFQAAGEAIDRARSGAGPSFLVMDAYRYYGHSRTDPCKYRTKEEEETWKKRDPIERFKARLIGEGQLTEAQFHRMEDDADRQIAEAVAFAEQSPYPTRDDLETDLYAEELSKSQ